MREDEQLVIDVLSHHLGGTYVVGEDPPDAYITINQMKFAVEVTRLYEHVVGPDGESVSVVGHEVIGYKVLNAINNELTNKMPYDKYALLIIPTPVLNVRSTIRELKNKILNMIKTGNSEGETSVTGCDANISVHIYPDQRNSGAKFIGAFPNKHSLENANITEHSAEIIIERIIEKSGKITGKEDCDEYWLALDNRYWIANAESYRYAIRKSRVQHKFNRIYLISNQNSIDLLYPCKVDET